jgi:hypothetical protein
MARMTLERAALQLAGPLGGDPLLIPRARPSIAGWLGWRHESAAPDVSGASIDFHVFPTVPAASGVPAGGLPGFRPGPSRGAGGATHRPSHPRLPRGSTTLYEEVVLTAPASVDAGQALEFVAAELGPSPRPMTTWCASAQRCACISGRT